MMRKYSHIIWDFNGTILDDVSIGIEAANYLLKKYGKKTIESAEEYRNHFCFPVIDYYEKIGLEREHFDRYAVEWVKEYNRLVPFAKMYDGVKSLLEYFSEHGYVQVLLSASESKMLDKHVQMLGIRHFFNELVGQDDIKAHGKRDSAVIWAEHAKPQSALFIGDSTHDAEVADAICADCALVASGHQSEERLRACGVRVFSDIRALHAAFINGEQQW